MFSMIAEDFESKIQENLHNRNASFVWQNEVFWFKQHAIAPTPFFKRLHSFLIFPACLAFLRPSPHLSSKMLIERELRKNRAFAVVGFPTPEVVKAEKNYFVTRDISPTIDSLLKVSRFTDPSRHETLLIACAEALGRAHNAGLCHGRPHPRDMFLRDDQIGFFDFEEEPEAVMPLATAQARDIWLLFLQLCSRTDNVDTLNAAFEAYSINAPQPTLQELQTIVRFSKHTLPVLSLIKNMLGKDVVRFMKSTRFLAQACKK